MKAFFRAEVPLWGVIIAIIVTIAGMLAIVFYFGPAPRLYSVSLPPEKISLGEFKYGEESRLSNPDIFKKVKDDFLAQKASFVEADLSSMKLALYQDGVMTKEVPILTKGKEGSWWETPAGIYQIQSKEKNHFSSFGHVYQPWSMAFQGNFFIHGWPYYEGGKPVSSQYSGGCIRLSDEDAKEIFALSQVGMPVLVFEQDFGADTFAYAKRGAGISAEKFLAADIGNNFVFLERGSGEPTALGSFSQFLLAIVSAEYINMEKSISLDQDSLATTSGRLKKGMEVTPFDLLHLMLLESSGEPFPVFGSILGEKRLLALMNSKARAVGMNATHLKEFSPKTLRVEGVTSAQDLFHLGKYLFNNRNFLLKMSAGKLSGSAYGETKLRGLVNENLFIGDARFLGGKAVANEEPNLGGDFFGIFEIQVRGEKRQVFIFLENSSYIQDDVERTIQYVQNSFE